MLGTLHIIHLTPKHSTHPINDTLHFMHKAYLGRDWQVNKNQFVDYKIRHVVHCHQTSKNVCVPG